jgi:dihydrofolate reductase
MARILGYIAASLDGFVAAADDSLDWLLAYNDMDLGEHGYDRFIARIRTVVMGRATYDVLERSGAPWPYAAQRVIVVTSRGIEAPLGVLETRSDVDALVDELRALTDGDVWMVGGGRLQMAFMQRGALDEIEIYVLPELLGGGPPLFPPTGLRASPRLVSAKALDRGSVRLHYALT